MTGRDPLEAVDWVLYALVGLGLLATAVWLPLHVVPSFSRMFSDFGGTLPRLTRLAIIRWPVPLSALPAALLLLRSLDRPFARIRRICLGAALAWLALAFFGWMAALYLPIWQLAGAIRPD